MTNNSKKARSYRKREHHITVRNIKKDPPDPKQYARALIQLAMEQQGLTQPWTRSELNALLSKFDDENILSAIEGDNKPRQRFKA